MMDETAAFDGPPIMKRLIESIEDETCMCRSARSPTDDAAGEGINHESDVYEALPGGHICEIRKPSHVR